MSAALGVVVSWWLPVAAGAGAGVTWLIDRARKVNAPGWPCACGHTQAGHVHFNRRSFHCGRCRCSDYAPLSVRAARRRDVERVRSLTPPPRSAVSSFPPFRDASIDDLLDEIERGAS